MVSCGAPLTHISSRRIYDFFVTKKSMAATGTRNVKNKFTYTVEK